jgi:TP53 regulating kinase-like protein
VDETHGVLGLEKIEGWSVREVLGGGAEGEAAEEDAAEGEELDVVGPGEEQEESEGMKALKRAGVSVEDLMGAIGTALARLHVTTIVHGDLTTSNMMVRLTPDRPGEPFEIVSCTVPHAGFAADSSGVDRFWIDNNSSVCGKLCCRPVRAGTGICFDTSAIWGNVCRSTSMLVEDHIDADAQVLEAYAKSLGEKKWKPVESKLKEGKLSIHSWHLCSNAVTQSHTSAVIV